MPAKPNKAPLAKALLVIMLVVLSTMGISTAEGLAGAFRASQVSDPLNVDHSLASRQKRYLRSAADVTSNIRSSSGGVRRLTTALAELERLPVSLGQSMSLITSKFQVQWWLWLQKEKTSDEVFNYLELKMGKELFESQEFYIWEVYIVATTSSKEAAIAEMYRCLWRASTDGGALAKVLGGVKPSCKFGGTARLILDFQMGIWARDEMGGQESVITLMGLDKKMVIGSPEFTVWGAYMTQKKNGFLQALVYLKGRLQVKYSDLLSTLANIRADNENFSFAQGLLYSHLQYLYYHKIRPDVLYKELGLESMILVNLDHEKLKGKELKGKELKGKELKGKELKGKELKGKELKSKERIDIEAEVLLEQPLDRIWLDYVYMNSYRNWRISPERVSKNLIFGEDGKGIKVRVKSEDDLVESSGRIIALLKKYRVSQLELIHFHEKPPLPMLTIEEDEVMRADPPVAS